MSTRTSRRGGRASTPAAHSTLVSTPEKSAPQQHRPQRSPSPLSPTRMSRLDEKKTMRGLNDRLAAYIDKVRNQEIEIGRLTQEISIIEESKSSEVTTVRGMYDKELAQTRAALDENAKERARLSITADKLGRENGDLSGDLATKQRALENAERDVKNLRFDSETSKASLKDAQEELVSLRPENERLTKKLADAKANLEDETLRRIDLENQLQTQSENYKFEKDMLQTTLDETKMRKQIELSEIDGSYQQQYEEKLAGKLMELRDSYQQQIDDGKADFDRIYEAKLRSLQDRLNVERTNNAGATQEMRELNTKVSHLTTRNAELQAGHDTITKRLEALLKDMEDASKNHRAEMARKDAEIHNVEDAMEVMTKDYKDLMEIKIALDLEIAAYRKMLEGEEERLGLSQRSDEGAYTSGRKRRRIEEDVVVEEWVSLAEGPGVVQIDKLEKGGNSVTLKNTSEEDVSIGGWKLSNVSGDVVTEYKFHRTATIAAGETCTVFSADAEQEHLPPTTLLMKSGAWVIGDTNTTTLVDKDEASVAARDSHTEKHVQTVYREAELYHSADDPAAKDKSCAIM